MEHDVVIKCKHFPRYRPPVTSSHKVNNCEAGDLRRHRADYDVIIMKFPFTVIPFLTMISLQIFAHGTTARLSYHVQNFEAMSSVEFGYIHHISGHVVFLSSAPLPWVWPLCWKRCTCLSWGTRPPASNSLIIPTSYVRSPQMMYR